MISTRLLPIPALLLSFATPAFAAEGGGLLDVHTGLIIWQIIVFLLVLGLLWKFAFPHILGAVEAREQRIRELLEAAARDREEAQALLAQQRTELEKTRASTQEVLAETRASGERMREEMLAETRREQQAMLDRTRRDIETQVERALDEVRADAVEIALATAQKLIRRNLDTEENRRLVREFMADVDNPRVAAPAGV
jgi:F-type H+-transporting ATPase subunit b